MVDQLAGPNAQRLGESQDQSQLRDVLATLDESDMDGCHACAFRQLLLSPTLRLPPFPHGSSERQRLRCALLPRRHHLEHCHGKY